MDGSTSHPTRDEDIDSRSGSDESVAKSSENQNMKRKRYHRHTAFQIQEMESFFKECPHPDDRQRRELSRQLGMEPLQVKFWFQNKRTQMKSQHEHNENSHLRIDNEKLRSENLRYREALSNASCPNCGGLTPIGDTSFHEHQLRVENARLREEIDHISTIATKYVGKPFNANIEASSSSAPPPLINPMVFANNVVPDDRYKQPTIVELAFAAMEELIRVAQLGEPLWVPSIDRNSIVLHEEEYLKSFSRVFGATPPGFKSEASRENALVPMDCLNVVELLMNVDKWSAAFSGIVSRATTLQVISPGMGGTYNDALQVMNAEFHVLSPLVPTRENYFVRYCKQHVDESWVVVDVSIDHLQSTPMVTCRRRPSGCIIQGMPNGYSKIIWVEHVDVQEGNVHSIYKPLIASGLAFGAKRWLAILEGESERVLQIVAARNSPNNSAYLVTQEGSDSMVKLAEKMVAKFCSGVSSSIANAWTTLSGNDSDTIKIMTRKNVDDPTTPFGIQLSVATSFWISTPPKRVFDYLRDHRNRKEWDMLSDGSDVQELMHILSSNETTDNNVAICQLNVLSAINPGGHTSIVLQETRSDPTASYVVYAPMDMGSVNSLLNGEAIGFMPLLPSGFAILPDGPNTGQVRGLPSSMADSGGSLLTVAFQLLIDPNPNGKLSLGSVAVASNLLSCTIEKIRNSFPPAH